MICDESEQEEPVSHEILAILIEPMWPPRSETITVAEDAVHEISERHHAGHVNEGERQGGEQVCRQAPGPAGPVSGNCLCHQPMAGISSHRHSTLENSQVTGAHNGKWIPSRAWSVSVVNALEVAMAASRMAASAMYRRNTLRLAMGLRWSGEATPVPPVIIARTLEDRALFGLILTLASAAACSLVLQSLPGG